MSANLGALETASGPLRVSENRRYFVDGEGKPFYFLADTQWELFRRYSLDDAKLILENRKAKGFTVVMVMLTGVGPGTTKPKENCGIKNERGKFPGASLKMKSNE